mgnify:CR=1 FL=1|tara:strand:+ start:1967 stop:2683 length:717 start_codon:yes stop_codon:yes gene_type:complete
MNTSLTWTHPRNNSTNRYPWFSDMCGTDTINKTVFDYGGCSGNLLYFSNGAISENKYTSLDVGKACIDNGRTEFPNSTFIHYDRFNWSYNTKGTIDLPFPEIDKKQDIIWAYSVFTHTDFAGFVEAVKWFTQFDYEKIVISYLDINCKETIKYFIDKRIKDYGSCIEFEYGHAITYFVDNHQLLKNNISVEPFECKHFLAFYNEEFLIDYFATINISASVKKQYSDNGSYIPFLIIER